MWAAEAPDAVVTATPKGDGEVTLNGTKAWCSGARVLHECPGDRPTAPTASGRCSPWRSSTPRYARCRAPGGTRAWPEVTRAQCNSPTPQRYRSAIRAITCPGPGFWHGAIGVAACWLGGARAVAEPLYRRAASDSADEHALAHLGAVDAALAAADAMLGRSRGRDRRRSLRPAGAGATAGPPGPGGRRACRRRGDHPHRPRAGPRPTVHRTAHTPRVADLTVYVRQSHAERDLAALGRLAGRSA